MIGATMYLVGKEAIGGDYVKNANSCSMCKRLIINAGIKNYTIWNVNHELFGYYECEKGVDFAAAVQSQSEIVAKWDAYMSDILIMEKDPVTGAQPHLIQVFEMQ